MGLISISWYILLKIYKAPPHVGPTLFSCGTHTQPLSAARALTPPPDLAVATAPRLDSAVGRHRPGDGAASVHDVLQTAPLAPWISVIAAAAVQIGVLIGPTWI